MEVARDGEREQLMRTQRPRMRSVSPSGLPGPEGMGYCSAVSIREMPPPRIASSILCKEQSEERVRERL